MHEAKRTQVTRLLVENYIAEADVPVLMLVLVHLTAERRWLEPPFRPKRDTYFFADASGGLPAELQAQVRAAAVDALFAWHEGSLTPPGEPSDELYLEMMRVCVAEPVPPEYLTMMLEEMGLRGRDRPWKTTPAGHRLADFRVLIVGAGMSGICAAVKLRQAGIPFTVVEKNPRVGGTWYENVYPEVGCDVPNHFYSYSFRPNPDWSAYFSKGEEIEAYFENCAREFGILECVRFGTTVTAAHWNDTRALWTIETRHIDGTVATETANVLVSAVGQLNLPKLPCIPGMEDFQGPAFHTARWPADIDLSGKRVAVVGNGASAMQLARSTAQVADRLTIFQRSAQWAIPTRDYHRQVSPAMHWLLRHVPYYASWYRFTLAWRFSDHLLPTVRRDPKWQHPERAVNARNDNHRAFLTQYIIDELGDRQNLLPKVLPDYPPYGKRILVDNHWYRTLRQDNVELVNDRIARITPTGIETVAGVQYPADVLVYATGFQSTRLLGGIEITGLDGRTLQQLWGDDDSRAYLGLSVPGFPNMFCLYGPNTNSGHGGSIILIAECQVRYLMASIMMLIEQDLVAMDCRQQAYEDYNAHLDAEHAELIWTHPGMDSWYRNHAGRVVSIMPFRLVDYWQYTREPDLSAYILR
jgi:4-hydroxyacetophenone monooxygenase